MRNEGSPLEPKACESLPDGGAWLNFILISLFFKTLTTAGKSVEDAVVNMQKNMENVVVQNMESLSAHLYFNRERQPAITMNDMSHLSNMLSELPKSVNAIWSVNTDDTLPDDMIRFTTILSGKGL